MVARLPKTRWFSLAIFLECKVASPRGYGTCCGGLYVAVKEYAIGFKMLLFNPLVFSKKDLSRNLKYVVHTGRVKVPTSRYVVPTGKDNVIVSTGKTKVIHAGRTILVLVVLCLLRVDSKGCREVVRLPNLELKSLGERGIECIFVGYAEHSNAFRFYVIEPNESDSINSIIEPRDVIFDENRFSSVPRPIQRSLINETKDIGDLVAINDEMDFIMGNNTWVLADVPPGYKWIFKIKLNVDLTIEKFKAGIVIQGFRQKSGIDYFDTYAPVVRISTIRLLIALASIHSLIIHQMDVKTAFLDGKLDEEAPKKWHQKFDEVVLSNDYLLNQADKCVDLTKEFLSLRFSMKYMEEADVILSIRIKHKINGITISQSYLIKKVLKKFNYFDYTPVSTPMDTSGKLMLNNGLILLSVGKLSRYTRNPSTHHWQVIKRVLKYLKKTIDYSLTYTGYPSALEGYTDASWINNTEDNLSTNGWLPLIIFTLSGNYTTNINVTPMDSQLGRGKRAKKVPVVSTISLALGNGWCEDVHVLIDNGSMHNFIWPDVVEKMCLPEQPTKAFKVYIGSRETLWCENVCSHVSLHMQGLTMADDLYVLPMQGSNVVLGIQWLQNLGKVTHDYP
ncbi:zinc finger, CCHC-type containing protein [Tanacetum coccineum]